MTELEKAARQALEALRQAVPKDAKQAREQLDAITALTQALATTERKGEPAKAELIAQARDLIEAQEHAHNVGFRMGLMAASERKGEPVAYFVTWPGDPVGMRRFYGADEWEASRKTVEYFGGVSRPLIFANTSPQVPEGFLTHRDAWRKALVLAESNATAQQPDFDDKAYWRHELQAFDRAYATIDAARKGE